MKARRNLARAALAALLIFAAAPVSVAVAEPPAPTIESPSPGSSTNSETPQLSGSTNDTSDAVTVNIYAGSSAAGTPVQTLSTLLPPVSGTWALAPLLPLGEGTYTAVAEQTNLTAETGASAPVTFTVDTTAPVVSLEPPPSPSNNASPTLAGSAGTLEGDGLSVTVSVYAGASVAGQLLVSESVSVLGGAWSYTTPHLADGTYTVQAQQSDAAGNVGTSAPATFTVDTTAPAVGLSSPADGALLDTSTPSFGGPAGDESGDGSSVLLKIYAGASASGTPVEEVPVSRGGETWTTGSTGPHLADGTYTAQATQGDAAGNTGASAPHTFSIKTDTPKVTLTAPPAVIADATPSFSGAADTSAGDLGSVTLKIFKGTAATGAPVQEVTVAATGATWASGAVQTLPDGTYTAQAQQADVVAHVGFSAAATFRVDTTPPHVTLTAPADASTTTGESQLVKGTAGSAEGDLQGVAVELFAGATASGQTPLESIAVTATQHAWSVTFGGLAPGQYTVRAEQRDSVGNVGVSATRTFEVLEPTTTSSSSTTTSTTSTQSTTTTTSTSTSTTPAPPQPPVAAFAWFPSAPHTGESVSLVSSSTDADSPIVAFAWDAAGTGTFTAGGSAITTSFSVAGTHVVRLRVTDANGLSSVVARTLAVTPPPLVLMQPFPIVRIAGSDTPSGAQISVLSVQAPPGARVAVRCRGGGCPAGSLSRIATARRHHGAAGVPLVEFRRLERALRAGAILEIRVSRLGQIGKYTRFTIRRGRPPVRVDECLASTAFKPIVCPPS